MTEQKIISCIGSYSQPIVDLDKIMHSFKYSGESEIKVSPRENSYAVSIIALCVLMIESIINRVKYIENKNAEKNLNFFYNFFQDKKLGDELTEIYIIRDCIFHNHLWEFEIKYDESYKEEILQKILMEGYSDLKYNIFVDKEKMQTKNLNLNINPIKICRDDVIKVFKFLYNLFTYFESKNKIYSNSLDEHIKYNEKLIQFRLFLKNKIGG